jgi:hypothetical protein
MNTLQRVTNFLKKANQETQAYVIGLILSNDKKNCANMARITGISKEKLYSFLANAQKNSRRIKKMLIDIAKETRVLGVMRSLVIDPTALIKSHAYAMENVCYDMAGSTKHVERCLVPVYASVVDKNVKIPLFTRSWVQKKIIGEDKYKSKVEIACDLISYCKKKGVAFDFVSLDGAFSKPGMFYYFENNKDIKFIMRMAKNIYVITENGERVKLNECIELKMIKNYRERMIKAELYGYIYFFIAQKRKRKNGSYEVIYLVSNMDITAKDQVSSYKLRWPIEKINRTTKQKFGSAQCQALTAPKQEAHIMAGFLAYAILELAENYKQKKSVDKTVNFIRRNHFDYLVGFTRKCEKSTPVHNTGLVTTYLQNDFQNFMQKAYSVYAMMP